MSSAEKLTVMGGLVFVGAFLTLGVILVMLNRPVPAPVRPARRGGPVVGADYWPLPRAADPGWSRYMEAATLSGWGGVRVRDVMTSVGSSSMRNATRFQLGQALRGLECQITGWKGDRPPVLASPGALVDGWVSAVWPSMSDVVEITDTAGVKHVIRHAFVIDTPTVLPTPETTP